MPGLEPFLAPVALDDLDDLPLLPLPACQATLALGDAAALPGLASEEGRRLFEGSMPSAPSLKDSAFPSDLDSLSPLLLPEAAAHGPEPVDCACVYPIGPGRWRRVNSCDTMTSCSHDQEDGNSEVAFVLDGISDAGCASDDDEAYCMGREELPRYTQDGLMIGAEVFSGMAFTRSSVGCTHRDQADIVLPSPWSSPCQSELEAPAFNVASSACSTGENSPTSFIDYALPRRGLMGDAPGPFSKVSGLRGSRRAD